MIIPSKILQAVRTALTLLTVMAMLVIAIIATLPDRTRPNMTGRIRERALTPPVPGSPIVGRATCGQTTWMLNRAAQLIELQPASDRIAIREIRGFYDGARPWGLACVGDGTLWTLETPHMLTQLARDGRVADRIALRLPRTALFAAGDRIVFHQLPTIAAAPLLASSPPRETFEVRAWPGFVGRIGSNQEDLVKRNVVNCGIASGALLPCWFADEAQLTISDGTTIRTASIRLLSEKIDLDTPIWDAAVAGSGAVWVLTSTVAAADGRRAGGSLLRIDNTGVVRERIDLNPPARLIASGDDRSCTLLTTHGDLAEIVLD